MSEAVQPATPVPPDAVLEVLYFAGGLRTRLYGCAGRPAWMPAAERVGLHNDVYLRRGQYAVDCSRFQPGGGAVLGGVTWLGVYGHAEDLYGDRGNFCGVGLWVPAAHVVDSGAVIDLLLTLLAHLQASPPATAGAGLSPALSDACAQALRHLAALRHVVGRLERLEQVPFPPLYAARCRYVRLGGDVRPGASVPLELSAALDALLTAAPDVDVARVLFVPASDVEFDPRVAPADVFGDATALVGQPPRRRLLERLVHVENQLDARRAPAQPTPAAERVDVPERGARPPRDAASSAADDDPVVVELNALRRDIGDLRRAVGALRLPGEPHASDAAPRPKRTRDAAACGQAKWGVFAGALLATAGAGVWHWFHA